MKRGQKKNGNEVTSHFEYRTITKDMKDKFTYIDLGLPSGRLWATENAKGYYTYNKAKKKFGELLPSPEAFEELYEECEWIWDTENKGVTIVGPNKNTIFLPASGFRDCDSESEDVEFVGSEGNYWADTSCSSSGFSRVLHFNYDGIDTRILGNSDAGFSVRLCLTANNTKNETI